MQHDRAGGREGHELERLGQRFQVRGKGANAEHAACAKKCIAAGEKPVLVTDKDQKVVSIDNPDALMRHLAHHVEVTGTMTDDGSLHVDKVKMLAQKGGTGGAMNDMQH